MFTFYTSFNAFVLQMKDESLSNAEARFDEIVKAGTPEEQQEARNRLDDLMRGSLTDIIDPEAAIKAGKDNVKAVIKWLEDKMAEAEKPEPKA